MAVLLKSDICFFGSNETVLKFKSRESIVGLCPSSVSLQFPESNPTDLPALATYFLGKSLKESSSPRTRRSLSVHAQASICVSRAQKWWDNIVKPNVLDIHSAEELVCTLSNAGDKLVVIDFYSPGCGGCRALHPKICQLAELYPDAIFLKVNYEELKTMCNALHIHVLPFFRFYRGAEGRVCSFSCTNASIKKFKDALSKYGNGGYSFGRPAKGLDESELQRLASLGEISTSFLPIWEERKEDLVVKFMGISDILSKAMTNREEDSSALLSV